MNNFILKTKKVIISLCSILLFFGLIVPSFANTANANTITNNDLNTEKELNSIVIKNEEIINQDLLEIEEQIKEYLDEIPYTEEEFEAMNDDEYDKVFEEYFKEDRKRVEEETVEK